jgi:hypothetical protein
MAAASRSATDETLIAAPLTCIAQDQGANAAFLFPKCPWVLTGNQELARFHPELEARTGFKRGKACRRALTK